MNLVITCQYFPYHTFPALQADNYESVVSDSLAACSRRSVALRRLTDDCGASE